MTTAQQLANADSLLPRTPAELAHRKSGLVAMWVRAHPVSAFLIWFFSVGWAIAFIPIVAKQALGIDLPQQVFIIASTWLGLLLPTLVITWLIGGWAGVRDMRRRILLVRVSVGWYVIAILAVPLTAVVLAAVFFGLPNATPSTLVGAVVSGLLLQTTIGLLTTNLWEEVAWMGLVQACVQARRGAMLAAILTAALFTLQHLPLLVDNSAWIVVLALVFALSIPFRALVGWLYNRTGSLLLVGLLHAAGDACVTSGFGDGLLRHLYQGYDITSLYPIAANALLGLAVIAVTRARLGQSRVPA
jgi:uncharacterized protein